MLRHLIHTIGFCLAAATAFSQAPSSVTKPEITLDKFVPGITSVAMDVAVYDDGIMLMTYDGIYFVSPDAEKILWKYVPPQKDQAISHYAHLANGNVVIGGTLKKEKGRFFWFTCLSAKGKKVWEKQLSSTYHKTDLISLCTDGERIYALHTATGGNKKEHELTTFDHEGNQIATISATSAYNIKIWARNHQFTYFFSEYMKKSSLRLNMSTTDDDTGDFYSAESAVLDEDMSSEVEVGDAFAYSSFSALPQENGFYCAYTSRDAHGDQAYRLIKVDDEFKVLWRKDYGGDLQEGLTSLIRDPDGNLIMAGYSYSGISGDKSEPAFESNHCDVWLVKIDILGRKLWDKTLTGPGCVAGARLFMMKGQIGTVFEEEGKLRIVMLQDSH